MTPDAQEPHVSSPVQKCLNQISNALSNNNLTPQERQDSIDKAVKEMNFASAMSLVLQGYMNYPLGKRFSSN